MDQIIVSTGDIDRPYEVLGPIYFQVSNKGLLGSSLDRLKSQYVSEIQNMKARGTMSQARADWGFLYGEYSVGQNDFEAAFFIATEELKKRAKRVGADAVICMRQDIDIDSNGFAYFYLQMYGTAVKFKEHSASNAQQYEHAEKLMSEGNFTEAEDIFFRLGEFRDSKEKAREAYAAQLAFRYARAEELMASGMFQNAENIFTSLRSYKDSKERAAAAAAAHKAEKERNAALREADPSIDNKGWTCACCGKANPFFVRRCACGTPRPD